MLGKSTTLRVETSLTNSNGLSSLLLLLRNKQEVETFSKAGKRQEEYCDTREIEPIFRTSVFNPRVETSLTNSNGLSSLLLLLMLLKLKYLLPFFLLNKFPVDTCAGTTILTDFLPFSMFQIAHFHKVHLVRRVFPREINKKWKHFQKQGNAKRNIAIRGR
ncbi:hypothetical protein POVCU2_0087080 [Plasmodium ovale curtisi]|uniref:Uncharacterized protein n=1 Tax=Plasmodium ovale curtisi TaxID=864141 RepID=A0A1A8WN14_PLAOA|nr:hypothetical protein POVCU2_0087080 [Plasmodium ovale curtisi]